MFYKARNKAIKLYDDYCLMASEAKNKAKNKTSAKELKILTPSKTIASKITALTPIKIDNNFENLLNEIRQIVYSLHQL